MTARERLGKVLPRPLVGSLSRAVGRARYARALAVSLMARGGGTLTPGALDCVIARNEHGLYCVPRSSRDRHEARTILQGRVWEPETIALLCRTEPEGDIVHAGTFFGDFLPALAHSRRNGALVWGFEPNGESYRCAQITTLLNGLENVVLDHAALDAEGGTGRLATDTPRGLPAGGGSRLVKDPSRGRRSTIEEVELVAVDEVVGEERSVAVIQLDVERHEQEALTGALRTIARCRPLIVLERVPEESWLRANLTPLGYRRTGTVALNAILSCE